MMPLKNQPIKTSHIKVILEHCEKSMANAASKRKYFVEYHIKEIYPGLPPIDTKQALIELYRELSKREDLKCYAHEEKPDVLVISWAHSQQKKD
jgi:hypothetical protein